MAHGFKIGNLGTSVFQEPCEIPIVPAARDPLFEAVDLICERPAAYVDGPVLVRIHNVGRYRAAVTAKGAPMTVPLVRGVPSWVRHHRS